jgi:hypothetical protein
VNDYYDVDDDVNVTENDFVNENDLTMNKIYLYKCKMGYLPRLLLLFALCFPERLLLVLLRLLLELLIDDEGSGGVTGRSRFELD